ncbi:3-hexulose-6-phosphate synthase [Ligilactobacillus salitolerans]|uniref:3-hexulose-6-phosphate synthase n=1 Tax=Ligilactobacillus salitolerans TaxID=1808352 RepID=A0A401IV83_9LACO|nr:3-hexulose-6-phosphate synthase [Ligilactobacillus salitolerans]GBG95442.1 3-hexulose-6-phosphate synthase [Ligilactobacillus salitolerans]
MKMQLALDDISLADALVLGQKVRDYVDIFEIGSPLIIEAGMDAVREFKQKFPDKEILADTKIVDAGEYEADLAFNAGADYCTVIGITDDLTIKECLKAAVQNEKHVFVDTINIQAIDTRIPELEELGVDHFSVHVGVDQQSVGKTPLETLSEVRKVSKNAVISVAGGINLSTVHEYLSLGADILIVGGGINHAQDPVAAAKELAAKVHHSKIEAS